MKLSLILLCFMRNKNGNRRSANVRSIGYSDLFCLSKDDLWEALTEYPEAKDKLLEMGQNILRKDNLLNEEALRKAQEEQENFEEKLGRIDESIQTLIVKLARLMGEFTSSHSKLKRRITNLEVDKYAKIKNDIKIDPEHFSGSSNA